MVMDMTQLKANRWGHENKNEVIALHARIGHLHENSNRHTEPSEWAQIGVKHDGFAINRFNFD